MATRLNKYLASATGISRRAADAAIQEGRVLINDAPAGIGDTVNENDEVKLDGKPLSIKQVLTVVLNKPAGYVCSRNGQGSRTIYELLPQEYRHLKPVGRLDKDSEGLLLLTNDGSLANRLTHPRYGKTKVYEVGLDKPLQPLHHQIINDRGLQLDDGLSQLALAKLDDQGQRWQVTMSEGRNRQIRRTFAALDYTVTSLSRVRLGEYSLEGVPAGGYRRL